MCKAHSKVTHIKQHKYFHHLKGRGYNKNSIISRALEVMKIFLLFYMCQFAMCLTHCYKTTVFLHLFLFSIYITTFQRLSIAFVTSYFHVGHIFLWHLRQRLKRFLSTLAFSNQPRTYFQLLQTSFQSTLKRVNVSTYVASTFYCYDRHISMTV